MLAIGLGFFLLDHPRPLDGDEPHYLVYADSLMRDRDADLSNNYDPRITGRFANGPDSRRPDRRRHESGDGKKLSPPVPLSGLAGSDPAGLCRWPAPAARSSSVLLLTAVGLTGLFVLLRNIEVNAVVAARGVAFLACTSPFITYGLQIYPEMAAGAGLVWGMALLTDKRFEGRCRAGRRRARRRAAVAARPVRAAERRTGAHRVDPLPASRRENCSR